MKRRIVFEYPWPCFVSKDNEDWSEITMYDMSFDNKFHYFKNHATEYAQLVLKVMGFGMRITWEQI